DASSVPPLVSKLGTHLKLLEGVEGKHHDERRTNHLLGEITQAERVTFAVERLALLPGSRAIPPALREEAGAALRAAGDAIGACAARVEAASGAIDVEARVTTLRAALARLAAAAERMRSGGRIDAADASNVEALGAGLDLLGDVVESRSLDLPATP